MLTTPQFVRLYMGAAIAFAVIIITGAVLVPLHLQQAVTQQCLTRDWPADKAVTTETWCKDNGYQVGSR